MIIFCFSSTGNSLYLAKSINSNYHLIQNVLETNLTFFEDDCIGIVFPCYAYNCPKIVEKFLKRYTLKTNYLFAIITYGNDLGGTEFMLKKIGKKNRNEFKYINHIKMVQNYIPEFDMVTTKNSVNESEIKIYLDKIKYDISVRKNMINHTIYKDIMKSYYNFLQIKIGLVLNRKQGKNYVLNDNCNKCMICVKTCPVNNIYLDNVVKFKSNCEACLGCIHHCPQKALHFVSEKSNERFLNKHINIFEFIKSKYK